MRSFVLRLVAPALAEGRIAGQVEAVQTGRVQAIGDVDELIAFLLGTEASVETAEHEAGAPWDR